MGIGIDIEQRDPPFFTNTAAGVVHRAVVSRGLTRGQIASHRRVTAASPTATWVRGQVNTAIILCSG